MLVLDCLRCKHFRVAAAEDGPLELGSHTQHQSPHLKTLHHAALGPLVDYSFENFALRSACMHIWGKRRVMRRLCRARRSAISTSAPIRLFVKGLYILETMKHRTANGQNSYMPSVLRAPPSFIARVQKSVFHLIHFLLLIFRQVPSSQRRGPSLVFFAFMG